MSTNEAITCFTLVGDSLSLGTITNASDNVFNHPPSSWIIDTNQNIAAVYLLVAIDDQVPQP